RDNTNSPTQGFRALVQGGPWVEFDAPDSPVFGTMKFELSQYIPTKPLVIAMNGGGRFSWGAPSIYQSSLSNFRAYTVGEQFKENMLFFQSELRIPFGKTRFGASGFGGIATLFDDANDLGSKSNYYPMGGAGLWMWLSEKQKMPLRVEYANGIQGARGFYIAMGQSFR
ncbi:MAG: hypothetical protein MK135_03330, partial [Polyangiaceae bacterium]|nr:hypothetical protein [Polyangiaceae bacterium]